MAVSNHYRVHKNEQILKNQKFPRQKFSSLQN